MFAKSDFTKLSDIDNHFYYYLVNDCKLDSEMAFEIARGKRDKEMGNIYKIYCAGVVAGKSIEAHTFYPGDFGYRNGH